MRVGTLDITKYNYNDSAELINELKDGFENHTVVLPYNIWLELSRLTLIKESIHIVVITDKKIFQDRTETVATIKEAWKTYSENDNLILIPDSKHLQEALYYSGTVTTVVDMTPKKKISAFKPKVWEICHEKDLDAGRKLITYHRKGTGAYRRDRIIERRKTETYILSAVLSVLAYIFIVSGGDI